MGKQKDKDRIEDKRQPEDEQKRKRKPEWWELLPLATPLLLPLVQALGEILASWLKPPGH